MGTDIDQLWADPGSPLSMAPVHAWRLPGRFQAVSAIDRLVQLLKMPDLTPYIETDLPGILSLFGVSAIPALHAILEDPKNGEVPRICAIEALSLLAKAFTDTRVECIDILIDWIKRANKSERVINGFSVSCLIDLKTKVSINAIRDVYQNEAVDPSIRRLQRPRPKT